MNKKKVSAIVIFVLIISLLLLTLFPIMWMISTSFKTPGEVYSYPPKLLPNSLNLLGYIKLFVTTSRSFKFLSWVRSSSIVAIFSTIFSLTIASLGGYGLSRFKFRGKKALMYSVLMTQVLPGALLLVPLYTIMGGFNLLDSLFGLILANITFAVPFCTWMLKGFFDGIPNSLDEAACIDGAGKFSTFYKVILPLTIPGLVATGIFSFITGWNEYLFASVFIRSYDKWTLPVGIASLSGQYSTDWATIMAGSFFITLPVVVLFLVFQKYLVSGMTAGAVKQ